MANPGNVHESRHSNALVQAIIANLPDNAGATAVLESSLQYVRNEHAAASARALGYTADLALDVPAAGGGRRIAIYDHILVRCGDDAEWATPEQLRRLQNICANIADRADAFHRWQTRIAPEDAAAAPEYTRKMATSDTRNARAELRDKYEQGEITTEEYESLYRTTSFMDLAR